MKRQGLGKREQGIANSVEELLRRVMPKVDANAGPVYDLWPTLVARIRETHRPEPVAVHVPWYDWALAAGLVLFVVGAPVSIPVLLYYL